MKLVVVCVVAVRTSHYYYLLGAKYSKIISGEYLVGSAGQKVTV